MEKRTGFIIEEHLWIILHNMVYVIYPLYLPGGIEPLELIFNSI